MNTSTHTESTTGTTTVLARLTDILREVMPGLPDQISPSAKLADDLDIDSLAVVEILVAVETAFEIPIDDSDISRVSTVSDIIDLIDAGR
ncbi:acyl carrier protein [Streptomyces sp. NPDC051569]|uniref:acyl carrier protein n=1 Tax=Streptomyces sp. NPDC051569 TaxID=3365661 RepID=UPI00378B0C81